MIDDTIPKEWISAAENVLREFVNIANPNLLAHTMLMAAVSSQEATHVTIPRAKLEAYRAAAEALFFVHERETKARFSHRIVDEAIAALRAAGIP